jgi:hypothetical protein
MKVLNTNISFAKFLFLLTVVLIIISFSFTQSSLAKQTITVSVTQVIHFGTFCLTGRAGGTVTLGYDCSRTSTGNIILLSSAPLAQPAVFEIDYKKKRNVNITFNPTCILTGSNGGTLTFNLGPTDQGINGSSFTMKDDIMSIYLGGTLHVLGTALPGTYTGSYDITFNTE